MSITKKTITRKIFEDLVKHDANIDLSKEYFYFKDIEELKNILKIWKENGSSWNWVKSNTELKNRKDNLWGSYFDAAIKLLD